ncbi:unnamed protein product [marine sediment metagenome]|uniref:Uncharacterized protein n=1 Tax=marine sediment metagenome TaxID=412755 RepID=X1NL32_9ZZZZ
MRICLVTVAQSVPGFEDFWFGVIQKGFSKVLRPDTEVVQKALKVGLSNPNISLTLFTSSAVGRGRLVNGRPVPCLISTAISAAFKAII